MQSFRLDKTICTGYHETYHLDEMSQSALDCWYGLQELNPDQIKKVLEKQEKYVKLFLDEYGDVLYSIVVIKEG